ncbi:hypothetical protein F3Y22_tig00110198pilonHSYRG00021 [Hibiscus syriacus]|uniref:COBRA C-terminal domain-containing protein n=1 Tax=Hibiscus syriacus TaxID=106335 RepID=A0A6A3BB84_HIBSY|nr:hypothetical protein F3Y22_tig00110198pilonHSYRG00021 [Hibiscus syriacus]
MYSFNGTALELDGVNNTIFMQGLPGLNYIVAETDGANPERDPRVPGKQQSVISFTKKTTPSINIAARDGFPSKVLFNGEECALPSMLPTNGGHRKGSTTVISIFLAVLVFILVQQ